MPDAPVAAISPILTGVLGVSAIAEHRSKGERRHGEAPSVAVQDARA